MNNDKNFLDSIVAIIILAVMIWYAVVYFGNLNDIAKYAPQCLMSRDPMTCAQVVRNGGK